MPGAELVLRVRDIVPSPETTIVVNCAGRTRSIIGAQSLINAGVPNKVVALRNGTMGWHLAGLTCDSGKAVRAPDVTDNGLAWAQATADGVARKFNVERIDRADVARFPRRRHAHDLCVRRARSGRIRRRPFARRDLGARRPTGAGDRFLRRHARRAHRAQRRQGGARADDRVLAQADGLERRVRAAGSGNGNRQAGTTSCSAPPPADAAIDCSAADGQSTTSPSSICRAAPNYRRGHIPGAWFAIRGRLDRALPKIPPRSTLVLTSEDGVLAGLAVEEARALTTAPVRWLKGGNAAWAAAGISARDRQQNGRRAGRRLAQALRAAGDTEAAMNAYLSWEVDLLERIKQDGTTHFLPAH